MKKLISILRSSLLCLTITLTFYGCKNDIGELGETKNFNDVSFCFSGLNIYDTPEIETKAYTSFMTDIDNGIVTEIYSGTYVAYVKTIYSQDLYEYKSVGPSGLSDTLRDTYPQINIKKSNTDKEAGLLVQDNTTIITITLTTTNNSNEFKYINSNDIKLLKYVGYLSIDEQPFYYCYRYNEYFVGENNENKEFCLGKGEETILLEFTLPKQENETSFKLIIGDLEFAFTKG